jgi:hypothetical protein
MANDPAAAMQLFLVVLGGRLPAAHIELHDVRFVVGATIDATIPELRRQWFGSRQGLHLDSWMAVRFVDGYRVELRSEPFLGAERLWFVNLGGYDPQQLAEQHGFGLVVARNAPAAKAAALRRFRPDLQQRHKDDLHGVGDALVGAVDDCVDVQLSLAAVSPDPGDPAGPAAPSDGLPMGAALQRRWAVHLIPDSRSQPQIPDWFGYRPI